MIPKHFLFLGGYTYMNKERPYLALKNISSTKRTSYLALLIALSVVAIYITVAIGIPLVPAAPFLQYDAGDIPMILAGFMFGPIPGLIVVVVASFIQAITISASSGMIGFLMHVVASGTMVLVSSYFYHKKKGNVNIFVILILSALARTAIMIPVNFVVTTYFWGMPLEVVKSLMLPGIIPFNLFIATINTLLAMLLLPAMSRIVKSTNRQNQS